MSTIQILTPTDIKNYSLPPCFDSFQRKKFFALPLGLMTELEALRNASGKTAFVLQCGYFRASKRFFGNRFYPADISFVANRLALSVPISLEILQLNSTLATSYGLTQISFNSTLVQLKNKNRTAAGVSRSKFQFHIGSIKKKRLSLHHRIAHLVSIPHWFN